MTDLKETLHNIAAAIVDDPDSVVVTVNETETTLNLTLSVAPDDMGKTKQGRRQMGKMKLPF